MGERTVDDLITDLRARIAELTAEVKEFDDTCAKLCLRDLAYDGVCDLLGCDREPAAMLSAVKALRSQLTTAQAAAEADRADAARWRFYADPQTALALGTRLDPNDTTVDWKAECDRLADAIAVRTTQEPPHE